MFLQLVVFSVLSTAISCQSFNLSVFHGYFDIVDENESIVKLAVDLIDDFYMKETLTLNFVSAVDSDDSRYNTEDIVEEIIPELKENITALYEDFRNLERKAQKRVFNIFLVDSYESFREIYVRMTPETFDYQGFYLIVFTIHRGTQRYEMHKMFDDLWANYVINVNIVLKSNPKECHMFTYFPFTANYCEKVFPVLLNTFISDKGFIRNVAHFPNKMSNMFECPITAATFELPPYVIFREKNGNLGVWGIEGALMKTLAQRMRFTLNYDIQDENYWGTLDDDGRSTGAIASVMRKEVNLTFGFFVSTPLRNMFMAPSHSYYTTKLVWVIGSGEPLNQFDRFYKPFSTAIWICLAFVFFVAVIAILIIRCQSRKVRNFVFGTGINHPLLNMFNVFIGGSMTKLPKRNFARTLLGLYLIYTFVIRNAYTGAMFRFLRSDLRTNEVKSFNEMIERDFSFFSLDFNDEHVETNEKFPGKLLVINMKQYETFVGYIRDEVPNIALLSTEDLVAYWNQKEFPEHFFNHLPQVISSVNLCLYMHKTSCLTNEINKHIMNFDSNGLMNVWKRFNRDRSYLKKKKIVEGPQKLTMENLEGAFTFLLIGQVGALLFFIVELIWKQIMNVHGRN
jgi:hypothetical protein